MRTDFDLLIIGGGMVGACLAALVASEGRLRELRIAVLDAHPPTAPPPDREVDLRVSAVSLASQRILDAGGAWSLIPARHLSAYTEMIVWDASGRPRGAGSMHFSAGDSGHANLGYIVENRRLQWAIYGAPAFRERVTVLCADLAGLEFEQTHATATLADQRTISAALIVGADGAASASRRLAGIETSGWDYPQHAFVTHVRTEHPHQHTAWQRFLPHGPIAFLPLADGRSSIVWTTTAEHAHRLVSDAPEPVAVEVAAAIGGIFGMVEIAGPRAQFPLRLTHARRYSRPRFVLVGDAAHCVHPLAGQGVNLGFLDCAALVEVLAEEMAGGGDVDSIAQLRGLRRYERWRKSENALALALIDGLNRLFSNTNTTLAELRRFGLSAVDRRRSIKKFLMERAMGTAGEVPKLVTRPR